MSDELKPDVRTGSEPQVRSSELVVPRPTPWPKEGDRVLHEASGKEGDVLSNVDGVVKVDWGLCITTVRASELEYVQ